MMKFLGILVAAAALALGACGGTQPIYNVTNAPVVLAPGKSASMNDVAAAIMRAGSKLGWQMQPEGPGRISGRIALRTHLAVIDVEHNTRSFSIRYRDSTNLNASGDMIHKNYNSWVQNLEKGIRAELAAI